MKTFQERIRKVMEDRGLRQADLGEAMGVVRSRITHIVNKPEPPHNLTMWLKAARYLSVSLDWLASGESEPELELLRRDLGKLSAQDVAEIRALVAAKLNRQP